jgi:serine/threonine protein kinase
LSEAETTVVITEVGMSLHLETGTEPIPGYRLVRKLGQGGFGEVWEADAPGGFRISLKFIRRNTTATQPELRALEVIRHVRHPHLLDIQFAFRCDDFLVIATPLCDQSLWDRLQECRYQGRMGLPHDELLGYMEEVAEAVDYLNEPRHLTSDGQRLGIQHRDIKPHNIFLVGGSPRLTDFGLVEFLLKDVGSHTGKMNPHYVAPEVFQGDVTALSDQYSLAATYCQLRSGQLPFSGDPHEVIYGHLHQEPDLSGLPPAERPLVARALSKQPESRWPSCREFVRHLRALRPVEVGWPLDPCAPVNSSRDRECEPNSAGIPRLGRAWLYLERYQDAAPIVFYSGLAGAALFACFAIGPAWIGFLAGFLPMSALMALAYSSHG